MFSKPLIKKYLNKDITVIWNRDECIHSTICYTRLREVFDPRKRPWINMQGSTTEEIIKVVDECPTSALEYTWNTKKEESISTNNENKSDNINSDKTQSSIKIVKNGPLIIEGNVSIIDHNDKIIDSTKKIYLCRCKESMNMPYCDGSHKDTNEFD